MMPWVVFFKFVLIASALSDPTRSGSFAFVATLCVSGRANNHGLTSLPPTQRSLERLTSLQANQVSSEAGEDDTVDQDRWTPLSKTAKILLPIQLILSIYMLILLPSGLALGKICGARVMGTLPYEYLAFFSLLVLPRSYKYGKFAKPVSVNSNGNKKGTSIAQVLVFVSSLVICHWIATFRFARIHSNMGMALPRILLGVRLFAITLVAASGRALGKSYDRVTRPDTLIQDGPYALVRHPIYTAYLLLFSSTLVTLRSQTSFLVFMVVASVFYWNRMNSEDTILADAFGQDFEEYKKRVPWRLVPFIV